MPLLLLYLRHGRLMMLTILSYPDIQSGIQDMIISIHFFRSSKIKIYILNYFDTLVKMYSVEVEYVHHNSIHHIPTHVDVYHIANI